MSATELRRHLTEHLERLSVVVDRVRLDEMSWGGGLCTVKGKRIVYLDRTNTVEQDIELLTDALLRLSDENTFMVPLVRDWLDSRRPG